MKGQFALWLLMVGLLLIGLAAPFVADISMQTTGLYSDQADMTKVVIWMMLPVLVLLFVYFSLFYNR